MATNKLLVKGKCFSGCEAKLTVGEEKTELFVCMDYLAKLSEYFRAMFYGDFKEKYRKEFEINDETAEDMICFLNAIDPDPKIQNITDDSIELLMRMADKYQCDVLKERLKVYIESHKYSPSTTLNRLIWSLQYHMPDEVVKMCLPAVACLPVSTLIASQEKIGLDLFNKMIDAKFKVLLGDCAYEIRYSSECWFCKNTKFRYCRCVVHRFGCPSCNDFPTTDANKEQCYCALKKYAKIFSS